MNNKTTVSLTSTKKRRNITCRRRRCGSRRLVVLIRRDGVVVGGRLVVPDHGAVETDVIRLRSKNEVAKLLRIRNATLKQTEKVSKKNLSIVKRCFWFSSQVYYWGFKSNTHNNYNYIIKTKLNHFNWKLFTREEEAPSNLGLGLE